MIYLKYNDFISKSNSRFFELNENVQLTKKHIKDKAISNNKSYNDLSDDEKKEFIKKEIDRDENFNKLKKLLNNSGGYMYSFYRFLEDGVPFTELEHLISKLKESKQFLNMLSLPFDKYGDIDPNEYDGRSGYEVLIDELDNIDLVRLTNKFVSNFTSDLKRSYNSTSKFNKEKITNIAKAFTELGTENGKLDIEKNKTLQEMFFRKISRYHNIEDFIKGSESFIKSSGNNNMVSFIKKIYDVNKLYGELNGADIIFDDNDILIIEVRSYQANKDLNSNTSHCIASSSSQWDSYVGSDNNFNKQYYIYNFNLSPSDSNSVIGITINETGGIRACHNKPDHGISGEIKSILKRWESDYDISENLFSFLKPMTPEEVSTKKKRVIANREIVKPDLKLSDYKKYIEDGADPNASNGTALNNAVRNDDIESAKYLLSVGSNPNLSNAIKNVKSIEMIKLLASKGSTIDKKTYTEFIQGKYDLIDYLLTECGMDPNFENGMIPREAANNDDVELIKLFIENGGNIRIRQDFPLRMAGTYNSLGVISELCKEYKKMNVKLSDMDNVEGWIMEPFEDDDSNNEKLELAKKTIEFIKSNL